MGKWNVVDNQTGQSVVYEGDSAPTETQLDNLFAEKSLSARGTNAPAGPGPTPPPAANGPGLPSRVGTALSMFPPIAMAERGAQNFVNPLMAAGRAVAAAVPPIASYVRNTVLPETGKEIMDAASFMGRGAQNLAGGMLPTPAGVGRALTAGIGGPEAVQAWGRVFSPPPAAPQDAPLAGAATFPNAPLAKTERVRNKVYMTPAGPRRWTGEGWLRLSG